MKSKPNPVSIFCLILFAAILAGCQPQTANDSDKVGVEPDSDLNPAAEGFNMEGSDERAIEIADKVMAAMGGRQNWDNTRFICWDFFGRRELIWDKWSGDVRINSKPDSMVYILNVNDLTGRVMSKDGEITEPDTLKSLVERGRRIWINDSYWLVMPYKLKDSGVTLKYAREDTTDTGVPADVITLSFEDVGVTPENWYEVWVDRESNMVRKWAYYRNDTMSAPNIISPWNEWSKHGQILLSGNRGEGRSLTNIMVLDSLPKHTFETFDPIDLSAFRNQ